MYYICVTNWQYIIQTFLAMNYPMNLILKFTFLSGILILNLSKSFSQETTYQNEKYVMILDVQQCWTEKSLSADDAKEMLNSINALIEKTDPAKVIYIRSIARVASLSFKGIRIDTLSGQNYDSRLKIVNNSEFIKTEGDAFSVKELLDQLKQKKAHDIIITGLLAEKCVSKTALGGIARKYDIYVIPETIGGKTNKSKMKAIEKLIKAGVKTV